LNGSRKETVLMIGGMGMNEKVLENAIWADDAEPTQHGTRDLENDVTHRNGRLIRWLRDFPWVTVAISFVAGGFLAGMWLWLSHSNAQEEVGNQGVGAALFGQVSNTDGNATDANDTNANLIPASERIMVDVKGDVRHPGVYTLPSNARARDAIRAAGGYVHPEDAAGVNEAMPLDDGMEFVVPNSASDASSSGQGTSAQPDSPDTGSVSGVRAGGKASSFKFTASNQMTSAGQTGITPSIANKIDLNTATESTLETVPGIGPKRAQAILAYRAEHGGFTSVSQLLQIRGIGPTLYQRISAYVIVNSVKNGQKP
jgi:competence ComEA-like helix-hairpin-helix protein